MIPFSMVGSLEQTQRDRKYNGGCQGAGGRCLRGTVWENEKVLGMDGGDGCTM